MVSKEAVFVLFCGLVLAFLWSLWYIESLLGIIPGMFIGAGALMMRIDMDG